MNVAYWLLAALSGVLFCCTVFFGAVVKEYRFRLEVFPPRWAGGLLRQIKLLREEFMSSQDRLNELVRLAAEDLAVVKEKLSRSDASEVIDFSGLDAFVNQLDALANSVADEAADGAPGEVAAPVEAAPVEAAPVEAEAAPPAEE